MALAQSGATMRTVGIACFAAAGASVVVAGLMAVLGGPKQATVAVAPLAGGVAITFGGTFP
jgi:hypothetical protein